MRKLIFILSIISISAFACNKVAAQTDTTFSISTSANPFDDQVIINITSASKAITGIKIFDAIGKEVSSFIMVQTTNRGGIVSYSLDFTNVKPGVYFCSIYSDKGIIETRKLFRAAR